MQISAQKEKFYKSQISNLVQDPLQVFKKYQELSKKDLLAH
jgi:hypothetical protein